MKRVIFLLIIVGGLVSVSVAQAAEQAKPTAAPARAVSAPAQNLGAKTIFDYQKEIGMTDEQVAEMKSLMTNFQKVLGEKGTELNALRQELSVMIQDKKEVPLIRKQLQKIADLQVDASCFDVETSRKVDAVLTPAQLAKWKALQETIKAQAVSAARAVAPAQAGK